MKLNDPIGARKCSFPAYLGNFDRPNDGPSANQQTCMSVHRKVTLPKIHTNKIDERERERELLIHNHEKL